MHPLSLTPPNPVPVPLPSFGVVMCAGCVSVLVGGMPAARAGDLGLAPLCFGLAPAFDIWFGSSNTWIGGSRAARMTDITRHCNLASAMNAIGKAMGGIGVVAGAVSAGASASAGAMMVATMQAAQAAADAAALAMSALLGKDPGIAPGMGALMLGNPTVLIGGFPMPDTLELLGGLVKGLKMLGKAVSKSKAFGKMLSKLGLCHSPGEPVHPFTGEVYNDFEDYVASDTGFRWERHYQSGWNETDGPLGHGFRHFYERSLTLQRQRAIYEAHDGETVALEKRDDGTYAPIAGFALARTGYGRLELRTDRGETLEFEPFPSTPPRARLARFKTDKVDAHLFYDAGGRLQALSESWRGAELVTEIVYDAQGHIVELRRGARGEASLTISRYAYEDRCLVAWWDPQGGVARFRYDRARRMVLGTDRRGYSFHWYYDARNGRCIKAHGDDGLFGIEASYEGSHATFTEADGGKWIYKHYPDGAISHIVGPDGGVMQYVKDADGRIVKQVLPGGVEVTWTYDPDGKHTHRRDQWQNLLPPEDEAPDLPNPLFHDGPDNPRDWLFGRPHRALRPQLTSFPLAIQQAVHLMGPFVPPDAPLPPPTRDAAGRVVEQRHHDGSVERFQRDAEGNVIAREDTRGNTSHREIESWNLPAANRSATGAITRYEYHHHGEPKTWIDANGNRSDYAFDLRLRVGEIRRHGTVVSRFARDAHGAVTAKCDGAGRILVTTENGPHGLPIKRELASGEKYSFDYDPFGNPTNASSSEHEIKQEHLRRYFFNLVPARVRDQRDGRGVRHGYDGDYDVEHTVYFERFGVEYRRLRNGRHRVFTPCGGHHDFYPMPGGELVRENGNATIEATIFDPDDRLCARVCWQRGSGEFGPHWTTRYRYNAEGELVAQSDTAAGETRYTYDADHRLIAQEDARGARGYAYDAAGNLIFTPQHRTIERREGNLLAYSDIDRFEYDERFRLAKRTRWDGRTTTYAYDSLDQLIEVRFSDTDAVWRAAYDGHGRRIYREFDGKRTDFYWDDDRLMAEVFPDGRLRIYVYANTDALVPFMWIDYDAIDAAPESGRAFFLFTHGTGMPVRVEDEKGIVVWRAKHVDPYGVLEIADGAAVDLRLRFAGHFYDEHTGLFYNRFRDYEPALGRYLQPDPIDLAGGINLYAYPSNPVVDVDLRGLVHKATKKPTPSADEGAPHQDTPLDKMTQEQMQDVCRYHADQLAVKQDPREGKKNNNTFSVGVIEDGEGKRRLVATSNLDADSSLRSDVRDHMHEHKITDHTRDQPPALIRVDKTDSEGRPIKSEKGTPERQTVDRDTGEVYDKTERSEHHAEQRMENMPLGEGESLPAQSPSQGCCPNCNRVLSEPGAAGDRPIDKIPADRRRR